MPQIHETQAQRDERMQWFCDAKFGMFIHWGPCSVGAKEIGCGRNANRPWDINGTQTPRTEDPVCDNYYKQFNPTKYNADEWVRFAKESGMKYMVLIAKHHDGFAQFDSNVCDHNIMASPYGKDIVRAYADACHKQGMKLGLYYSTRDWHHPDYLLGDNKKYDEFYRAQVKELLSNYGAVDVMWFYLHVYDWPLEGLGFDSLPGKVIAARTMTGAPVVCKQTVDEFTVEVAKHIVIENRANERWTEGLIMSVSEDGQKWQEAWRAGKWDTAWTVPLTHLDAGASVPGQRVRFILLETNNGESRELPLKCVTVFGVKCSGNIHLL